MIFLHDQFRFLARRSPCAQLLATLNDLILNVDHAMKVDAVYTNIAKAFVSVSHSKLLLKVEAYGFKSYLLKWITGFLNDRIQCVYIGVDLSPPISITSGVTEGSVLGPLYCFWYILTTFLTMFYLLLVLKSLLMTPNCILLL